MVHYFAEIDEKSVVKRMIVAEPELIKKWQEKEGGKWVETTPDPKNDIGCKHYAGIGCTYMEELKAFVAPQPFKSWTLNKETALWEAPIPYPKEGSYVWNEKSQTWVLDHK
jgi:hypothetical protein